MTGLQKQISEYESKAEYNAKLRLVRSVAHDLLTPISQMDKYLFLLKAQSKNEAINSEVLEGFDKSLSRLRNLAKQTKDLKNTELMNVGKEIDLISEISEIIDNLNDTFENDPKKINLVSNFNKIKSAQVIGDKIKFDRLISNLVKNAKDASPSNSDIEIAVCENMNKFILTIKDYGHGISEQNLNKIFDPDFTTRPATGTGLGLSIVKEICESMSAKISVVSTIGKGTAFEVIFPRQNNKGVLSESQNFTH